MADNYKQPGKVLTFTAPSGGVVSGSAYMMGAILAVALASAAETEPFEGQVEGVWTLDKTSAQAWTVGAKIYWNASTSKADSDATTGPLIGVATEVADNPSSTGVVRLNGGAADMSEGPQAAIADIETADGSDAATTQALANATKATVNTLLAELRLAGIIAAS